MATLGAVGCFTADNGSDATSDLATANAPAASLATDALKSTLILDAGCTAAKVGPRHLLLAARCVAGNDKAFAAGSTLTFHVAESAVAHSTSDAGIADAAPVGALSADAAVADAGAPVTATAPLSTSDAGSSELSATIGSVAMHPSFVQGCASNLDQCAIGSLAAGDVKDVALITLTADLTSVPTIPVDLDIVGQSAPLLTVGSGCAGFDGKPTAVTTTPTIAVPAKAEVHFGSAFQHASMSDLRTVDKDYVITPGIGWNKAAPALCRTDLGAPLFRADKNAVAGITAGFTTYDKRSNVPVTLQHARVDSASQVGTWLQSLGVTTIRSCNGTCAQLSYDGGMPDLNAPDGWDGGDDDGGFALPSLSQSADLGPDTDKGASHAQPEEADAGAANEASGGLACTATPGAGSSSALVPMLGLMLAVGALRRRR